MKNNILVRAAALTLGAACILTGCSVGGKNIRLTTGLSDSEILKVDGSPVTVEEAKIYLTTEKNIYENSFGSDIWGENIGDVTFEEYVKDNVKDRIAEIKTLDLLAKKKKIKLNDDEVKKAKSYAKEYYSGLSETEIKYMGINESTVTKVYKNYLLADKVYDELTKDVNPEVSDADAKVIKVATIYKKTYSIDSKGNRTEYTDDEKADQKSDIQDLLDKVNSGEDFETVAANNTDADQVEYQFGKGEMIQEFEDAAYALSTGEMSGIVETTDGYYIIKCLSDYMEDETQENKEKIIEEAKNKAFKKIYEPYVDSISSEFNTKVWKSIKFTDMTDINVSNFYEIMGENETADTTETTTAK